MKKIIPTILNYEEQINRDFVKPTIVVMDDTQIANGNCRFLISEQEAKVKLLGTKIGQKMKPAERLVRLNPHIEVTKLFEEICNLKVKNTSGNTVVE